MVIRRRKPLMIPDTPTPEYVFRIIDAWAAKSSVDFHGVLVPDEVVRYICGAHGPRWMGPRMYGISRGSKGHMHKGMSRKEEHQ